MPTPKSSLDKTLQEAYGRWQNSPSALHAGEFVAAAKPIVDRMMVTVGQDSPGMRGQAKLLLIDALPKFQSQRGVPLSNWAYTQLQPLRRAAAQQSDIVPVPEVMRRQLADMERISRSIEADTGIPPDDATLAERLKITPARLRKIRTYGSRTVSESAFISPEGEIDLPGTQRTDPDRMLFDYVYHDLSPSDRVLVDLIQQGVPKQDIARRLKITPSAVTQRTAIIAGRLQSLIDSQNQKAATFGGQSYGCLYLPVHDSLARRVVDWALRRIDREDLFYDAERPGQYGVERDVHVTCLYGLQTDSFEDVQQALQDFGPINAEFGEVSFFSRGEKDYDVVKIDVGGARLHALHQQICDRLPHVNTFNDYRPHCTIAYVKKGRARGLDGSPAFVGESVESRHLIFSDANERKYAITL